ncbi:hypothetical protein Q5P01_021078 [Channa striata]|uniref:Uncharacterized protein n=1 Tax=Channa striata TaxID=64152 RepID=A0AA88LUV1_CHASR|nr:hypothetical protein Q5P01_021078 [Channa striata]
MDFIVSFYRTLSEYADNFAVVHSKAPHVKVLIESPSENVGYVTGSVTVTLLYGTSVLDVCYNMSAGVRDAEEGEELDLGAAVAQLGDFVFDNVSEGIRRSQDLKQVSRTTGLRRVGRGGHDARSGFCTATQIKELHAVRSHACVERGQVSEYGFHRRQALSATVSPPPSPFQSVLYIPELCGDAAVEK